MNFFKQFFWFMIVVTLPSTVLASSSEPVILNAVNSTAGKLALGIFILAYCAVILEEFLHLRKSKPVILASGLVWILVALIAAKQGNPEIAETAVRHNILEYGELFLFLLVAMTYVNAMEERKVFDALRSWLVSRGFSFRQLFWTTGLLAFFISPAADNLTTALIMCAVIMAVGKHHRQFVAIACVNIVIAANAGGAYSPFGDITTLMVWQKGALDFFDFFSIFLPSVVSYVVPAAVMSFFVPKLGPPPIANEVKMALGAKRIIGLFLLTIATAISFHNFLHLPPAVGMMTGLSYLKFFGYYLKMKERKQFNDEDQMSNLVPFDIIRKIERAEWDTLLFFYGVILCVGGLSTIGYLQYASGYLYLELGTNLPAAHQQTPANIIVGFLSAVVDNIPVMFAVLTMGPDMSKGQWLLVTLTAGIGGSLLSVGSAAGVALMGQARGYYTFFSHLKWAPVILVGYFAGIACHVWLNADLFEKAIPK